MLPVKSYMAIPFAWLFRTRRARAWLLILALYLACYAMLSLCGRYQDNLTSLREMGITIRGISDREEWQPRFTIVTHFPGNDSVLKANVPGYVFLPLVLLDQRFCHKTQPIAWYDSAASEYTRVNDCLAFCVLAGCGLLWLIFPAQIVRVYAWFRGDALKLPPTFRVRVAGALWIVLATFVLLSVLGGR